MIGISQTMSGLSQSYEYIIIKLWMEYHKFMSNEDKPMIGYIIGIWQTWYYEWITKLEPEYHKIMSWLSQNYE